MLHVIGSRYKKLGNHLADPMDHQMDVEEKVSEPQKTDLSLLKLVEMCLSSRNLSLSNLGKLLMMVSAPTICTSAETWGDTWDATFSLICDLNLKTFASFSHFTEFFLRILLLWVWVVKIFPLVAEFFNAISQSFDHESMIWVCLWEELRLVSHLIFQLRLHSKYSRFENYRVKCSPDTRWCYDAASASSIQLMYIVQCSEKALKSAFSI